MSFPHLLRPRRWMLGVAAALPALAGTVSAQSRAAPTVQVVAHQADKRVDVLVDGKPFTSYIWPETLKKASLYPIRTASGKLITRGWPIEPRPGERTDHPHHVGLWFNHSDVNGLDFWNNSTAIPAAQANKMGTIVHRAIRKVESGKGKGVLEVTEDWVKPDGKVLMTENTRYVFHAGKNLRTIDRITTLTAKDEKVTFNDNKDGTLGLRVTRALELPSEKPQVFTDGAGRVTPVEQLSNEGVTGSYLSSEGAKDEGAWSTRGKWMSLGGTLQGEPVSVVIYDHPSNYNFPTYWHARGYGLFAANPLGAKDFTKGTKVDNFTLAPGKSTTFRYRVAVFNGPTTPAQVEAQYKDFTK